MWLSLITSFMWCIWCTVPLLILMIIIGCSYEKCNVDHDRLHYPPALKKLGLERDELRKLLKSKMTRFFKCNDGDLPPSVEKIIENVIKDVGLRPTLGDSDKLDQRMSANKKLADGKHLKNTKDSPQKHQKESGGSQGNMQYIKEEKEKYHKKQYNLFLALKDQEKLKDDFDEKGYLLNQNGECCSTVVMCNKVDAITKKYTEELLELDDKTTAPGREEEIRNNIESLNQMLEICISIVSGRICVDMAVENDIMTKDGYKQWQEHVWVIMTFAALFVIMDALSTSLLCIVNK